MAEIRVLSLGKFGSFDEVFISSFIAATTPGGAFG
jgi:uncharacterized membrane protein